jgi:hypothetical protein
MLDLIKLYGIVIFMTQYQILLRILDCLREEAPAEFASFHPDPKDTDKLNAARSKAYIHLFLKVKFGITNFKYRHSYVTDGSQDGGVDAYFIDTENKKLYLIQSKFRTTEDNFTARSITAGDLVKMEVRRILKGEETDSSGKEFNSKIKQLQSDWSDISDQAKYDYRVIILGNLTRYNHEQIKRLLENTEYEIFNFERSYNELVFPLCSGTYYDPTEIRITINLYNKEQSTLKQTVTTKYGDYDVRITFVPVEEIAKIMLQFKNSLLKYNPRNFLTLSHNKINQQIKKSIVDIECNEFAVFNNGITVLADKFSLSETTGQKFRGQLILTNPQIINGGQTAYTLAKIYEEYQASDQFEKIFGDKEVLLKIIVRREEEFDMEFIENLSDATNKQTMVSEADRRSNLKIQVQIQKNIYNEYGLLYGRKSGEFYHGEQSGYIESSEIINRNEFLRTYHALKGNPRDARQKGEEVLFRLNSFYSIIDSPSNYRKMFFAWKLVQKLAQIEQAKKKENWNGQKKFEKMEFGMSLRYGKMAVISAVGVTGVPEADLSYDKINETVSKKLLVVLRRWKAFEDWAKAKKENKDYETDEGFDFDNYYKGKTLNKDIASFFKQR